mgnify:CR=1 FL=1
MVKWKKMDKENGRTMLLGVMMLFTASTTAFAMWMNRQRHQSRDNSDGTVNRQRREKGRGDKHKRGAAGRWNRQGNCIYDTWQW